jgi:MBG domain (YGX type)/Bacterial Ig-like domain (group 3)
MRSYRLAAFLVGLFSVAAASAAQIVLYDGTAVPTDQGWQQSSDSSGGTIATQVESDGTTRFTTTTTSGSRTSARNIYYYSTGASNYIASIRLKVLTSSDNLLDAGLMFTTPGDGTNSLPVLNQTGRSNMLTITNGQVLWGDLKASATVAGTDFHEYAIRYQNGNLDVYVDATYADIQSGVAAPVLSRTPPAFTNPGVIVFGDQTNDANVDSDYYVDFVKFQNLDVADPTLAVTSSGQSNYGDSVTFTATLSNGSNPTGTVTICADDATCAAPSWSCTALVSGTTAACSTATLTAGNHSITASYAGDAHNSPASTAAALAQAVASAELDITPTSGQSKVYGSADPASFAYNVTGLVAGSTLSGGLGRAPGENVGSDAYTLGTLAVSDPGDYRITLNAGTFAITPAPLTITANNAIMTYGGALPVFSATYAGFVNGDTTASLTTPPTLSTTATSSSPAGTYPITPAGAVAANYSISYVNGVLTISSASSALNLTPPANLSVGSHGTITATSTATNSTQNIVISTTTPAVCSLSNVGANATQASATVLGLSVGSCALAASQAADANYTAQLMSANVSVGQGTTGVTITLPPSATVGQPMNVSVTVTTLGTTVPTGTVMVTDSAGDQCAINLPATSCSLVPSRSGNQTVTAAYSGDSNFAASTNAVTVNVAVTATATAQTPALSLWMLISLGLILAFAGAYYARASNHV